MNKKPHFKYNNSGNLFLFGFGLFYLLSILWQLVIDPFFGDSETGMWISFGINPVAFIGATVLYARRKNVDFLSATRLKGKINPKQAGLTAILSLFCIMAFLPMTNFFIDTLTKWGFNSQMNLPDTGRNAGVFVLSVVALAVFPAFAEEIFMRGGVLNCLEQKRDYVYAMMVSGALFSLMHANPLQTVHQFLLGVVLAYVVLVTRSLWAGILLHFCNNFLSLTLDFPINWFLSLIKVDEIPPVAVHLTRIACTVVGCVAVVMILRKLTEISKDAVRFSDETVIDVYPEGKIKGFKANVAFAFGWLGRLFTRRGFKQNYEDLNFALCEIQPYSEIEEPTREDFFPSRLKPAFFLLAVLWLLAFVENFIG